MSDPYEVLGLTTTASETEIRQRYLELVRSFPPDREPERFSEVHAAYEALRDPALRVGRQLFEVSCKNDSFEAIARDVRTRILEVRLPVAALLALAD
jgi:curved DNA-binding protein CbpA